MLLFDTSDVGLSQRTILMRSHNRTSATSSQIISSSFGVGVKTFYIYDSVNVGGDRTLSVAFFSCGKLIRESKGI